MPRSERIGQFIYNRLVPKVRIDGHPTLTELNVIHELYNINDKDFIKLLLEYYNDT